MGGFTGDFEIGTSEEGRFAFPTIPPGREYFVYTMMKDAKRNGGVAPVRKLMAGRDGEMTAAGDLASCHASVGVFLSKNRGCWQRVKTSRAATLEPQLAPPCGRKSGIPLAWG